MVQKYLAIIDLTSGKRVESADYSAMLLALADRLKGVAQAFDNFDNLDNLDKQPGQRNDLGVLELYAWLVYILFFVCLEANIDKDECTDAPCGNSLPGDVAQRDATASDSPDGRYEGARHSPLPGRVPFYYRTHF